MMGFLPYAIHDFVSVWQKIQDWGLMPFRFILNNRQVQDMIDNTSPVFIRSLSCLLLVYNGGHIGMFVLPVVVRDGQGRLLIEFSFKPGLALGVDK